MDGERNLPLHLAVENGHVNLIKFCIEKSKTAGELNCHDFKIDRFFSFLDRFDKLFF